MFCNSPKTDEGDIARLGPTTIIGMTIPRFYSSLVMTLDDTGGLAGPIKTIVVASSVDMELWALRYGLKISLNLYSLANRS